MPLPQRPFRAYLITMLLVIAIGLVLDLLVNLLVDPFNIHRLIGGDFAIYRVGIATRIGKSEGINSQPWEVILLGNSRAEVGLDPQHPGWKSNRVFNAGLPGSPFGELAAACDLAMRNPSVRRIVLCTDWTNFTSDLPVHPDNARSLLNPQLNRIDYEVGNLLSLYTLDRSVRTITNWSHGKPSNFRPDGFSTNIFQTRGADWNLLTYHDFANPDRASNAPRRTLDPKQLQRLDQLLTDAKAHGVSIDLINPPIHAISFERLRLSDELGLPQQWLHDVARLADGRVSFWDFGGYNRFTTEPFPALNETSTNMQWYWDPDHFKKKLGDLMIDRITAQPPPEGMDIADFGRLLTSANVEERIAAMNRGREDYLAARPELQIMFEKAREALGKKEP